MDLILWRHAEAEDIATSDLARRLTAKGERQAQRMADWLGPQLGNPALRATDWCVVASPAARAQQPAAALNLPVKTIDSIAPDAPADAILRAAGWPNNKKHVIVVGHEPTLGMVAGALINSVEGYVPFKKGAIRWFRSPENDFETRAILVTTATPETIAA